MLCCSTLSQRCFSVLDKDLRGKSLWRVTRGRAASLSPKNVILLTSRPTAVGFFAVFGGNISDLLTF